MEYTVVIRPEGKFFVVECLELTGCVSQGESREEALKNIREAIRAYLEVAREDGISLPNVELEKVKV